jgi:hypothetical protein
MRKILMRPLQVLAALLLAWFALPLLTIPLVLSQIETIAAGRPLCLEIAAGPDHRSYARAKSLMDLRAGEMLTRRDEHGLLPVFHAVLFVENPGAGWGEVPYERYNWSYWMLRFMPIEGQGHASLGTVPDCSPARDYIDRLVGGTAL